MSNPTRPEPIVDKNGVVTTRHKKVDSGASGGSKRVASIPTVPARGSAFGNYEDVPPGPIESRDHALAMMGAFADPKHAELFAGLDEREAASYLTNSGFEVYQGWDGDDQNFQRVLDWADRASGNLEDFQSKMASLAPSA